MYRELIGNSFYKITVQGGPFVQHMDTKGVEFSDQIGGHQINAIEIQIIDGCMPKIIGNQKIEGGNGNGNQPDIRPLKK